MSVELLILLVSALAVMAIALVALWGRLTEAQRRIDWVISYLREHAKPEHHVGGDRQALRVKVQLPAVLETAGARHAATVVDLSSSGARVETASALLVDGDVTLVITGTEPALRLAATVARVVDAGVIGVRFAEVDASARAAIGRILMRRPKPKLPGR